MKIKQINFKLTPEYVISIENSEYQYKTKELFHKFIEHPELTPHVALNQNEICNNIEQLTSYAQLSVTNGYFQVLDNLVCRIHKDVSLFELIITNIEEFKEKQEENRNVTIVFEDNTEMLLTELINLILFTYEKNSDNIWNENWYFVNKDDTEGTESSPILMQCHKIFDKRISITFMG